MKKPTCLAAALGLLILIVPASALAQGAGNGPKARIFAKYDSNKNGVIDGEEIAAVRKAYAAEPKGEFATYDKDHDGKLSAEEIAAIKPPGSKKGDGKKDDGKKKTETEKTPDPK